MTPAAEQTTMTPGESDGSGQARAPSPSWIQVWGTWTAFALLSATVAFVQRGAEEPAPLGQVVVGQLAAWWPWALLTPAIFGLARRFPVERETWLRALPVHVVAGAVVASVYVVVYAGALVLIGSMPRTWEHYGMMVTMVAPRLPLYVLVFGAIDGLAHAIGFYHRLRERERRTAALEVLLAESRLEALRGQLRPHFLFNALHAVGGLVRQRKNDEAVRAVSSLSALLRASLETRDETEVPLAREMDLVERYLEIERARYGERLRATLDVDAEAGKALVPPLLLQPLVENAIRHGIDRRREGGRVHVEGREENGRLRMSVWNEAAETTGDTAGSGIGLANVRERLETLYGDRAVSLSLDHHPDGGTIVTIRLPYRVSGDR